MKIHLVFLLCFLSSVTLSGQVIDLPDYEANISTLPYYGGKTPFWFVSNNQAKFLPYGYNSMLEVKSIGKIDHNRNISFGYGIDLIDRYNRGNKAYINQAYLEGKLFFTHFLAGAKHTTFGNQDSTLSSGGLLYSGNARPMPKLTLGTDGFVDIPLTFGYLEVSAGLEHGWFENSRNGWMDTERHGKQVFYHHKYLKGRIGGDLPVHGQWGFHHYAQWGGQFPGHETRPTDFSAFRQMFFAKSADTSTSDSQSDILNKYGNHIGGRMAGLEAQLKNMRINIYWQTIFEDGSGLKWQNIQDGLWGVSIKMNDKKQIINGICFEYLHTTMQSGPVHDEELGLRGNDNYFNNSTYQSGWSYFGYTLGNPFITSPVYEEGEKFSMVNNKVIVHHYGFEGNIYKAINYKLLFSFHDNFGTNDHPYDPPKGHISSMLAVFFPIDIMGGLDIAAKFAADTGKLYGFNMGCMFSVIKRGTLSKIIN